MSRGVTWLRGVLRGHRVIWCPVLPPGSVRVWLQDLDNLPPCRLGSGSAGVGMLPLHCALGLN